MSSIKKRFLAAVNVIKGLSKNGPYRPTTAMIVKFYGFFKQATEGASHHKKPAYWDNVGKAKWKAWNNNRHLTKHQTMSQSHPNSPFNSGTNIPQQGASANVNGGSTDEVLKQIQATVLEMHAILDAVNNYMLSLEKSKNEMPLSVVRVFVLILNGGLF